MAEDAKNGVEKKGCPVDCPCKQFKVDICDEFDCHRYYCIERGHDCEGKYWETNCIFHGEHLELNKESSEVQK